MKAHHVVRFLLFLSVLPPIWWEFSMVYKQITEQIPHLAATAGIHGALIGYISMCGVKLAEVLWQSKDISNSKQLAVTTLFLFGLFAVGRETGEFGAKGYGDFFAYFSHGFMLGVPAGLMTNLLFWFPENKP